MARYRDYPDDDRNNNARNEGFERDRPWNFNESYGEGRRSEDDYRQERFGSGRFGERADYQRDEPRFTGSYGAPRQPDYSRQSSDRNYEGRGRMDYGPARSRLRVRDIMTRDLAVATRDSSLVEIALMMKEEDTGVIPIVDHELREGNGGANSGERRAPSSGYSQGKLIGLVTDRDIVVRGVTEGKDGATTRAEEIMSTDIETARPNDRVIDVIRKMAQKQVRRIPVVSENGYLRGMVSMGDIALETEADRELAEALEEISKESSFWGRIFN